MASKLEIAADDLVKIFGLGAVALRINTSRSYKSPVVGHHHAAIARASQVLTGEETEAAGCADAARLAAVVRGGDGLRGIASMTARLCSARDSHAIWSISAICPNRWTGMIALVCGVMAAGELRPGRCCKAVQGSISTKTGLAPRRTIDPAVAKKVNGVVITSSPGPILRAIRLLLEEGVGAARDGDGMRAVRGFGHSLF